MSGVGCDEEVEACRSGLQDVRRHLRRKIIPAISLNSRASLLLPVWRHYMCTHVCFLLLWRL